MKIVHTTQEPFALRRQALHSIPLGGFYTLTVGGDLFQKVSIGAAGVCDALRLKKSQDGWTVVPQLESQLVYPMSTEATHSYILEGSP